MNIEDTIQTRRELPCSTEKELWVGAISQFLMAALGQVSGFKLGTITVQYEIREPTAEHPHRRVILTGDVSPRIKVSEIVQQVK